MCITVSPAAFASRTRCCETSIRPGSMARFRPPSCSAQASRLHPRRGQLTARRHKDEIGVEVGGAPQHGLAVQRRLGQIPVGSEPGTDGHRRIGGLLADETAADDDIFMIGTVRQLREHHIDGARLPDDQHPAQRLRTTPDGHQIAVYEPAPGHAQCQARHQGEHTDLERDLHPRRDADDGQHAQHGQPVP